MKNTYILMVIICLASCVRAQKKEQGTKKESEVEWQLSDEEWKAKLSDLEYYVIRQKGTERAFTGEYWDNKENGIYICRACRLPLFSSKTKYKSGTGWPSFWQPLIKENVAEEKDYTLGMIRTEVLCKRCGGHLGHLFDDGPNPTGLRYCLNSASLTFEPEEK